MKRRLKSTLLVLLLFSHGSYAQFVLDHQGTLFLDSVMTNDRTGKPGAVLAISVGNELVYEKGFGLASLEWGIEMPTDAVFEAASVSKQFTATAVLKLVERGQLSLDDNVREFVPELPDYGHTITIRHLLTMTSGLRDWRNTTYLQSKPTYAAAYSQDEATATICRQQALNFDPGARYSYSNSNYDLLHVIVQRITGESFVQFTTREVLDPVAFMQARWRDDPHRVEAKKVRSYAYDTRTKKYKTADLMERTHGAAGMLVTAADLIRWNNHWAAGRFGEKMAKLRLTQGVLLDGTEIDYACGGVRVTELAGLTEVSHSGLLAGYRAWVSHYPKLGVSIACLTNDRSFQMATVRNAMGQLMTGQPLSAPKKGKGPVSDVVLSVERLRGLEGVYKAENHYQSFEIEISGNVPVIGKDTLVALARDTLLRGQTRYRVDAQGTITVQASDGQFVYCKVSDYQPGIDDLQPLEGTYSCADLSLELRIQVEDGKLYACRSDTDKMLLKPTYKDGDEVGFYTLSNQLRTLFAFVHHPDGKVGLTVSIPRAEHFTFTKYKDQE
ncbi:serine hydrolase domain-containing protein [Parapedobacter tibetensis]|uniref:serine hydrolase domain-containing protein n=1 Tax=Parapedobacter tibetensis TaxID=2972951 RepID=UPI00214DA4F9|nr:serine hydrolase domain-containing protein [Parapedobacter tibetensis]